MSWIKDRFTPKSEDVKDVSAFFTSTKGLITIGVIAVAFVVFFVIGMF